MQDKIEPFIPLFYSIAKQFGNVLYYHFGYTPSRDEVVGLIYELLLPNINKWEKGKASFKRYMILVLETNLMKMHDKQKATKREGVRSTFSTNNIDYYEKGYEPQIEIDMALDLQTILALIKNDKIKIKYNHGKYKQRNLNFITEYLELYLDGKDPIISKLAKKHKFKHRQDCDLLLRQYFSRIGTILKNKH